VPLFCSCRLFLSKNLPLQNSLLCPSWVQDWGIEPQRLERIRGATSVDNDDFDKKFSLAKTLTNIRNTSNATTNSSNAQLIEPQRLERIYRHYFYGK
jgi:hypothetical protein